MDDDIDDDLKAQGECLRTLMRAGVGRTDSSHWTNASLAGEVECSEGTVSNWVNGKRPISTKHRDKLLKVLFPNPNMRARYPHEHDTLSGFYNKQRDSDASQPIYSKKDVWDLILRSHQSNVERLVVEGSETATPGLETDHLTSTPLERSFHIPVPDWFADWADTEDTSGRLPYEVFDSVDLKGDASLSHIKSFDLSGKIMEAIQKHAEIYAREVHQKHTDPDVKFPPYNKSKVGLLGWRQPIPANSEERAYLTLNGYETDYFTHRVMRAVTQEVREKQPDWFADLNRFPDVGSAYLAYFTTSVGINIVTVTKDMDARRIQLSKTTEESGNCNQRGKWHVSANEGLNMDDVFPRSRQISFEGWVRRALNEELGLTAETGSDPIESILFTEFSFEMTNFEPFLSCLVHLDMTREALVNCMKSNARDARRESAELKSILYTPNGVIDFLLDNQADPRQFTTFSLLILDLFMARGLIQPDR